MTVADIIDLASVYTGETIDNPVGIRIINLATLEMGERALVQETTDITATDELAWHDLPPTAIRAWQVENKGTRVKRTWPNYEVYDRKIRLPGAGEFTVYYFRCPNAVSSPTETPDVHPVFHSALASYLAGWVKLKDDDENPDGLRLMQEFKEAVALGYAMLSRERAPALAKAENDPERTQQAVVP